MFLLFDARLSGVLPSSLLEREWKMKLLSQVNQSLRILSLEIHTLLDLPTQTSQPTPTVLRHRLLSARYESHPLSVLRSGFQTAWTIWISWTELLGGSSDLPRRESGGFFRKHLKSCPQMALQTAWLLSRATPATNRNLLMTASLLVLGNYIYMRHI